MAGHGSKIGHKQEEAIVALLECSSPESAAERLGIGSRTLYRWMSTSDFKERYRAARGALLENAISRLQKITAEAVTTLRNNLLAKNATAQISAAKAVMDYAIRGKELMDLGDRIERLEELLAEMIAKKGK